MTRDVYHNTCPRCGLSLVFRAGLGLVSIAALTFGLLTFIQDRVRRYEILRTFDDSSSNNRSVVGELPGDGLHAAAAGGGGRGHALDRHALAAPREVAYLTNIFCASKIFSPAASPAARAGCTRWWTPRSARATRSAPCSARRSTAAAASSCPSSPAGPPWW